MKQWAKEFTHNAIFHPLMAILPFGWGTRIHDWNAEWVWPDPDKGKG